MARIERFAFGRATPGWGIHLAPLILGTVAFLVICGPDIVSPGNIAWLDRGDPSTHYLGWVYFRADAWHFPIGLNPDYGLGISNAIIYSDSNPVLAVIFKALSPLLPETFQYFGIWILGCFVAQAYLAWRIVRLATKNDVLALLGATFFVFSPPMLWRLYGHLSLVGHFFILAALYLLLAPGTERAKRWWFALLATSAAIHAYLFVCVGALWTVYVLRELWSGNRRALPVHMTMCVTACLVIAWQVGYLSVGSGVAGGGYGAFRANLLTLIDSEGWSYLTPDIANPAYDIEGFAFLGLGALLLVPVAVWLRARHGGMTGLRVDLALFFICAGLAAFAISHKVGFADFTHHISALDFIVPFGDIFRASGRLVWPAYYLLLTLVICTVIARLPVRAAALLLAIAICVQVVDTRAGWRHVHNVLTVPPASAWNTPLIDPYWDKAATAYSKVVRFPIENQPKNWQYIAHWAAQNGMATSIVYLARIDLGRLREATLELEDQLRSGRLEPDTLYLVDPDDERVSAIIEAPGQSATVRRIDGFTVLEPNTRAETTN